jgi:peptide/nickel transport system permease protein
VAQYALRRLLVAVPMLIGAMSLVFLAMRILPGDPCMAMLGEEATWEALRDCTRQLGLDRPLYAQYVDYVYRWLQFDFGRSLRFRYTVSDYLWRMFPHTFLLVTASTLVAIVLGIPAAVLSALNRRNPLVDYAVRIVSLLGLSIRFFTSGFCY